MPLVKMLKFHASATEVPMFAGRLYNISKELQSRLDEDTKRSGSPAYQLAKVDARKVKVLDVEVPVEEAADQLNEEIENDSVATGKGRAD